LTAGHTPRYWLAFVVLLAVAWAGLAFFSLRQDRSAFEGTATGSSAAQPPVKAPAQANDAFGFGAGVGAKARCGHRCPRP
jgi:hypothetical protein